MYKACVNGIGIPYFRLLLCPGKGLAGRFSLYTQIDRFPNQMSAVFHTAHICVMLAAPESAGNKTHTLQFCSGSVSKLHHHALHPCRVTVAVSAAFAGELLSGEVLDAAPPILPLRCGLFPYFLAGQVTGNTIGSQPVFPLPLSSSILRFLSCKTIDCNFSIGDLFLKGLDDFYGFRNGQHTKYTVCIQGVILLKTNGSRFRMCAPDPIDPAALVAEVI